MALIKKYKEFANEDINCESNILVMINLHLAKLIMSRRSLPYPLRSLRSWGKLSMASRHTVPPVHKKARAMRAKNGQQNRFKNSADYSAPNASGSFS